jgi:hypothetical protein
VRDRFFLQMGFEKAGGVYVVWTFVAKQQGEVIAEMDAAAAAHAAALFALPCTDTRSCYCNACRRTSGSCYCCCCCLHAAV